MGDRHPGWGGWALTVYGYVIASSIGCTGTGGYPSGSDTSIFAALGLAAETVPAESEGNDSFAAATLFEIRQNERTSVGGTIDSSGDIDVFDLGPVNAGDHLSLDVFGDGVLDAVAALFDADANLIYLNDDRSFFSQLVDPHIDVVLRRNTERCYLAVASSPGASTQGRYRLEATLTPDFARPEPVPQTVLLNFDGASGIEFAGRAAVDIPPFEAGAVSETLIGETESLAGLVLEAVRDDFVGLDVDVYSSRGEPPPETDITVIHFGAYDPKLLGVAENIDEFNERTVQEAIVFTDTFSVFNVLDPSIEDYAQALANVASHEIGHLLGLVHTADETGLMDITASLRQLMRDQVFSVSPLESFTMPLGFQDAPATLVDSVGGDLQTLRARSAAHSRATKLWTADEHADHGPVARASATLSTCRCRGFGVTPVQSDALTDAR